MKSYTRIFLSLLLGIGCTQIFYSFIEKGANEYHVHKFSRMREIYKSEEYYDILCLGSSRTHVTIYPSVIDSITGLSSYNAGIEGGNLYEFKITLQGYLVHHKKPKVIVLCIDAHSFNIDKKVFYPLQYFEQINNPVVYDIFKKDEDYNLFFIKNVPFLRLIYFDDYAKNQAISGLFRKTELSESHAFQNKGFLSNGFNCLDTTHAKSYLKTNLQFSRTGIEAMTWILNWCRLNNVQLMLTYAPEYRFKLQQSFVGFDQFLKKVDSLRGNLPFYREDSLSLSNNPCYFANYGHVNTIGAIEYSKILGTRIKELYLK